MITFHTNINKKCYPHIALDLGYSHNKASCGIMHSGIKRPVILKFGNTIREVSRLVEQIGTCVLIIEGVLSTYHDENGNPEIRGVFEKGRGWYHGPGVVTFAAAIRFLKMLRKNCMSNDTVFLTEAFLSFKKNRSNHSEDAWIIFNSFWETSSENLKDGTEPILDFIVGVPNVKVFTEKN